MTIDFSRFNVKTKGGIRAVSLGADVGFYMDEPPQEIAGSILDIYEKFLGRCHQEELRWYRTNTMESHQPITGRTLGMLNTWLRPGARPRKTIGFEVRDGEKMEDTPTYRFSVLGNSRESPYFGDRANWLQILLPAQDLEVNPNGFTEFVTDLCDHLTFSSGHAGYVLERSMYVAYEGYDIAYPLAMRHPGADISDMMQASRPVKEGAVKGVNWLTILAPYFVERLGGLAQLHEYAQPGVSFIETKNGSLVKAGQTPGLGDVNRQDTLTAYRAAFRLIKPLLVNWYPNFWLPRGDIQEQTSRWLYRFDDDA